MNGMNTSRECTKTKTTVDKHLSIFIAYSYNHTLQCYTSIYFYKDNCCDKPRVENNIVNMAELQIRLTSLGLVAVTPSN